MHQDFFSALYLISFVFSSLLARATAPYTLSKAKIMWLYNSYSLSKKYKMNFKKIIILKCFKYLNKF